MIFQHTWQKVLSGEKTQTRRIVKAGEWFVFDDDEHKHCVLSDRVTLKRRLVYEVGKTYAVQPARTAKAITRIRITRIRQEDVRRIATRDRQAEGFRTWWGFMETWLSMHDKPALRAILAGDGTYPFDELDKYLSARPAHLYQAWALDFEVVK